MPALPRSRATSSTASYTFAVPSISRPRDCADCPVHPAEHRCRADECEEQGCTQDDVVFHLLSSFFSDPPVRRSECGTHQ